MKRFLSTIVGNARESAISMREKCTKLFRINCISEPEPSAEYIISHVLGRKTFTQIPSHEIRRPLTQLEITQINTLCKKRLQRFPIQYVLEEWDFGDLNLKMKPPVFIPRPETFDLVNIIINDVNSSTSGLFNLLEVGVGSGAITLSLLHAVMCGKVNKDLQCMAIDTDVDAVKLAKENAKLMKLDKLNNVTISHCDVTSLSEKHHFDGIVSNPPYIPTRDMLDLQPEIAWYESTVALHGGYDGLDIVREILRKAENVLCSNGWIWLEVDTTHPALISQCTNKFILKETKQDFLEKNRFVKLIKAA